MMKNEQPPLILSLFRPREYRRRMELWQAEYAEYMERSMLAMRIREAKKVISHLESELDPARTARITQALAQWRAHLDSLLDDGDYAIPKGQE